MGLLKQMYNLDVKCTIEPYSEGNVFGLSFTVFDELKKFRRIVPWQDFDRLEAEDKYVIGEILAQSLKLFAEIYGKKDGEQNVKD